MNSTSARRRHVIAALLVVTLLAAACSGSGDETNTSGPDDTAGTTDLTRATPSPIQTGGVLRYALNAETSSGWDPANSQWGGGGTTVSRAVFDRIAELDDEGRPQPNLAESITPNADFTEWTIVLRPDITFHNGEPLNAEAVKLNLDRARTSVLLGAVLTAYMGEVVVTDDLTVVVNTLKPWSTFPYSMTTQTGTIAAPEQLNSDAPAQDPIGTGPFVFEEWIPDNRLTVTRNDNYWQSDADGNQLPYLDGIEFTVIGDQSSRGASLDSGSIDAMNTFEPQILERYIPLAEDGTVQLISNEDSVDQTQFIGLNTVKHAVRRSAGPPHRRHRPQHAVDLRHAVLRAVPAVEQPVPDQLALLRRDVVSQLRPGRGHQAARGVPGEVRRAAGVHRQPAEHAAVPGHR